MRSVSKTLGADRVVTGKDNERRDQEGTEGDRGDSPADPGGGAGPGAAEAS